MAAKKKTTGKKKRATTNGIRRKASFGGANIDHFSPPIGESAPTALNVVLSFEEALKLHLSLGQALGHINGYDRSTKKGRHTAVNLCIYQHKDRVVVVEGKAKSP